MTRLSPAAQAAATERHRANGLAAAHRARRLGAQTGWHRPGGEWRLSGVEAMMAATTLEACGRRLRAEAVHLAQGCALVEVRSLRVRWTPLIAVLRTPGDVQTFLAQGAQEVGR